MRKINSINKLKNGNYVLFIKDMSIIAIAKVISDIKRISKYDDKGVEIKYIDTFSYGEKDRIGNAITPNNKSMIIESDFRFGEYYILRKIK